MVFYEARSRITGMTEPDSAPFTTVPKIHHCHSGPDPESTRTTGMSYMVSSRIATANGVYE